MFSMSSRTSRSITTTTIIVVPSPSALFCPLPILALLLLCLAQQRTTMMADAFLLSHRNLLLPFASSKGAAKMTGMDKDGQGEDRLGALVVDQQEGEKVPKMPMRLLGFMALPKSAVEALRRQMDGVEKGGGRMERTEEEGEKREETEMMVSSRPRRKRMHHLSILRKVGAPNGQMLGSRLFGPQKHTRELKRTVPLFLVEY